MRIFLAERSPCAASSASSALEEIHGELPTDPIPGLDVEA
jgi:hypothetical protein